MAQLSRRTLLAGLGAALAAPALLPTRVLAAGPFVQPALPYAPEALAPVISAQTVELHYAKHHAGYFRTLNRMVEGTPFAEQSLEDVVVRTATQRDQAALFDQAGQAWNHILYWEQMRPGGPATPPPALAQRIDAAFGSFDAFKTQLIDTSSAVFGSGWGWLVEDTDGSLSLMATRNGDNPLARGKNALLGIDVWEHAYYLDYQNRRKDHVRAVVDRLINWSYVADRLIA